VDWLVEANISGSVMSPSSGLKNDTASFSETVASTKQSTWRLNPKERHLNGHCREKLKSYNIFIVILRYRHRSGFEENHKMNNTLACGILYPLHRHHITYSTFRMLRNGHITSPPVSNHLTSFQT
jgi:hypothetical protein